jgi:PilZ domain
MGRRSVSGKFGLDGGMIPRSVRRVFDERGEPREPFVSQTAVLAHRGRNYVVKVLNVSNSGAMVNFPVLPHIGEAVTLQLLDWGQVHGKVRWVRDGKIGINFAAALE